MGLIVVAAITAGPLYLSHRKARKGQEMAHQDNVALLRSIDSKMDDHHRGTSCPGWTAGPRPTTPATTSPTTRP